MAEADTLNLEPRWYAAYTRARHERRVAEQLAERAVDYFLPQYESVRRWKDRRVQISSPLFPSYVFVHIPISQRLRVLTIPSVVRLVGVKGQPTPLPNEEMEKLRNGLSASLKAEPHPFLSVGRRVRVVRGPLEGLEGILLRSKGVLRLVVSLKLIQRSISVELDADAVQPASFQSGRWEEEKLLVGSTIPAKASRARLKRQDFGRSSANRRGQ